MTENGYQGYKNYQTWNVALWIGNEYGTYNHWQYRAEAIKAMIEDGECDHFENGTWTAEKAARYMLADEIKADLTDTHPLTEQPSMYSDILGNAMGKVDWQEVADSILEE